MSILNCLDCGAVARSSLIHLGQWQGGRQKVRCILLTSSSQCFSTQLNSRQRWSFARSIGSILCKIWISLRFGVYFYQCLTFTLLHCSITALSQRIVFKVAEEPPLAKWLQPAFISLVFLMLSLGLHFFFLIKQKTCIYFFVIIEAI